MNTFIGMRTHRKLQIKYLVLLVLWIDSKDTCQFRSWNWCTIILSHLQFGITCWGFECNRLFKLQKRALRIMTNSKYNAHTEPIFKDLKLLKLDGIFDIQCMKFFYKFTNNTLPKYFHSLFKYNREIYEIVTRNYNQLHLFPTRTHSAENVLRHHIPKLIDKFPRHI